MCIVSCFVFFKDVIQDLLESTKLQLRLLLGTSYVNNLYLTLVDNVIVMHEI